MDKWETSTTYKHEMEVIPNAESWEFNLHQHYQSCNKNPDHVDFVPVNELSVDHLPIQWQCKEALNFVKQLCHFTVRLTVRCTSPKRPDHLGFADLKSTSALRVGSGCFDALGVYSTENQMCPYENCLLYKDPHLVSPCFKIRTAAHVVYDDQEAENTVVEFFYDNETDQSAVVKAVGVGVHKVDVEGDVCWMDCITHDLELLGKLKKLVAEAHENHITKHDISPLAFIISHPHGCSKMVTFGTLLKVEFVEESKAVDVDCDNKDRENSGIRRVERTQVCRFRYNIPTCRGSSGAPFFVKQICGGKIQGCYASHSYYSSEENFNESGLGKIHFYV